jgi:hypothetical protein
LIKAMAIQRWGFSCGGIELTVVIPVWDAYVGWLANRVEAGECDDRDFELAAHPHVPWWAKRLLPVARWAQERGSSLRIRTC